MFLYKSIKYLTRRFRAQVIKTLVKYNAPDT